MLSRYEWALIASSIIYATPAIAFDPFTVAAVVGTGANAVSAVSDAAGEVAASADAFGELYGEIDSDAEVSENGQKLIREIREIESMAYEAGYTKDEIEQLTADAADSKNAKKLSATLKTITRAIRTGKRVARLAMKLEKKAQLASVEAAQIEREQLVVLYKQLQAEHERELNAIKEKLKEERDRRNQIATIKAEEKKAGAQVFGRTGVLSFPRQDSIVEEALKMATAMRPALLSLILFIFFVRAMSYQFGFFGPAKYGDLIRDTIICTVLLMAFPDLVRACVAICNDLAARVGMKELQDIDPGKLDFPSEIGLFVKTRLIVEWLFQWIKYLAFITARFLANFGLGFLILLFPIVIFGSQMLNFSIAWPIFLGGFLSVCLWPLFWNATGMLAVMLWRKQDASLSDQIATILFGILQFLSPLIGIACLKGQPLSKSIQSAGRVLTGAVTGGAGAVASQVAGMALGTFGAKGGGTLGRVVSYPANQALGRVISGVSRGVQAAKQGKTQTGWKPVLKAAVSGVVTNQVRPPVKKNGKANGSWQTVTSVASGMKRQNLWNRHKTEAEPRTTKGAHFRSKAKSGGKNVQAN